MLYLLCWDYASGGWLGSFCILLAATRIFCLFVDSNFLDVNEIDPIGRHLSQSARTRYGYSSHRYSSFKVNTSKCVTI